MQLGVASCMCSGGRRTGEAAARCCCVQAHASEQSRAKSHLRRRLPLSANSAEAHARVWGRDGRTSVAMISHLVHNARKSLGQRREDVMGHDQPSGSQCTQYLHR
eukprot:364001-Chlamydomonas_euryale.AAC.8